MIKDNPENKKPVLSSRFDAEDIRRLREYNSLRHINMTADEYINELRASTKSIIEHLVKSGHAHVVTK